MAHQQREQGARWYRKLGRFWTAANVLSLLRAVLVVPITYLILVDGPLHWLIGLIVLAALTDWMDGTVARWSHTVSEWGKVLDPLADKFAAAAVTFALVLRPAEPNLPLWFLVLVVIRDLLIVLGGVVLARRTGRVLMSIWWGKVAVTALAVTVGAVLLKADEPVLQFCLWATTGLMVYAFVLYMVRFWHVWRTGTLPEENEVEAAPSRPVGPLEEQPGVN